MREDVECEINDIVKLPLGKKMVEKLRTLFRQETSNNAKKIIEKLKANYIEFHDTYK